MSAPFFLHVMSTGDMWISNNIVYTPVGTITGTYRINSDAGFQKIGTLSGTINSSLAASGKTGKNGKEIT